MPKDRRSTLSYVGYVTFEFLVLLFKVLWLVLVGVVKTFLPVQKKDASKEIVLVTGAGSGIGRLMTLEFAKLGATVRSIALFSLCCTVCTRVYTCRVCI